MHNIDPTLKQAIIDGYRAVLVRIVRADNTAFGYTDHDMPIDGYLFGDPYNTVFKPAPGLKRINLTATTDDRVSNQEFASGWVDAPEEDLLAGLFDNAEVETMICSWKNPEYGSFTVDKGKLGVIQWTADGFRGDVQSHMRNLTRNINFTYTAGCRHKLFSQFSNNTIGACTLNQSSYKFAGSVGGVDIVNLKFTSSLAKADGYFTSGTISWSTGDNLGVQSPIKYYTTSGTPTFELMLPTPYPIQVGDNFEASAGCDKTFATCKSKFNNVINFGGFPHMQVEITTR